ncbi:phosphatase PAP2 family protein [Clostridium sp. SHJSY1]|uniref:phosphatase PAP2 family protein n=1 Tax=Clostridium sp. SHJSY1 TaxID=2942483 RepID=UPI0028760735|nr:phosphatase PAP2 family protein [Clostridium sp. SHJSY1]MDS0526168.1 phosphatase PAP2 family protein [Clostridium sp. SHJSY1]
MQFIQQIDNSILMLIHNNITNPFFDSIMPVITGLANGGVLWVVIGLILICSTKYRKSGLILLCALALCFIIGNLGIKPLVARVRPFDVNTTIHLIISKPKDFSFPSGHTMHSFAAATVLYYTNKRIGIGAYILAIIIGFSRLYLYVHYPSDVLFGIIIGVLLALVSIKLCEKVAKKANEYKALKDIN